MCWVSFYNLWWGLGSCFCTYGKTQHFMSQGVEEALLSKACLVDVGVWSQSCTWSVEPRNREAGASHRERSKHRSLLSSKPMLSPDLTGTVLSQAELSRDILCWRKSKAHLGIHRCCDHPDKLGSRPGSSPGAGIGQEAWLPRSQFLHLWNQGAGSEDG